MLFRFAFGLVLLFLGIHVGRELARSAPAHRRRQQVRAFRTKHAFMAPVGKVSVH